MLVYSFSPRAQSIQRGPLDNAAMFFYAAIVLCASTRQNGKSDLVGLLTAHTALLKSHYRKR